MRSILARIAHWYVPRRRAVISTSVSVAEVVRTVAAQTGPGSFLWSGRDRLLFGKIKGPDFKVRISRLSFIDSNSRPVLVGEVRPRAEGGATLSVVMRLDYFTQAFWLLWAGAATSFAILFVIMAILGRAQNTFLIPVPFAMLATAGLLIVVGPFERDWRRVRALLDEISGAKPSPPSPVPTLSSERGGKTA